MSLGVQHVLAPANSLSHLTDVTQGRCTLGSAVQQGPINAATGGIMVAFCGRESIEDIRVIMSTDNVDVAFF